VVRFLILFAATSFLSGQPELVHIDIRPQAIHTFDPAIAIGAGIDGHEQGEIAKMLSPANVAAMRSAGLHGLTYRLRTELAGEAWHWNPEGSWSDAGHAQGYWISAAVASKPISVSYGYRLPRRGNTKDQANDDSYSRLDDGDVNTFWKSNPYLDRHFTGEPDAAHPQWVVMDLGRSTQIDMLRVRWAQPFATAFRVEYANGSDVEVASNAVWRPFINASALQGNGGEQTITLAPRAVSARYIRLLMTAYSGTGPPGSTDVRDRLGVAIREIYAGTRSPRGFADRVHHFKNHNQSTMYVSSTDPWHRGLAMLTASPVLYDVPENARNEIRYLRAQGYPVTHVELGEEPEGQHVMAEEYGALYLQWSKILRDENGELKTGGPSLVLLPADSGPEPSWTKHLLHWLGLHQGLRYFDFFSFEWYPYDEVCEPVPPQLARAPELFAKAIESLRRDGVSRNIPMFITEYGYSAYGSEAEVTLPGALLNAETVAQFLTLGGARAYLYGYEPNELINEKKCSWGNNMLLLLDDENGGIKSRFPTYYAARLLSQEWAQPEGGIHEIYQATSDNPAVSAFAVHRPDGKVALLLLNKDPRRTFRTQTNLMAPFELIRYSQKQFAWRSAGENGKALRDLPPVRSNAPSNEPIALPPYSLTVVRGRL
jgi:F5/8 type C domain-containing protein